MIFDADYFVLMIFFLRIMPVITQVAGFTGGAITEQLFILVMYTIGVGKWSSASSLYSSKFEI